MVFPQRNAPIDAQNLPALKRQAKQRLWGTVALLIMGVVLFAWLLRGEPRPSAHSLNYSLHNKGQLPQELSVGSPEPRAVAATPWPDVAPVASPAPATAAAPEDSPSQRRRWAFGLQDDEDIIDEPSNTARNDSAHEKATLEKAEKERLAKDKAAREKTEKAEQQRLAKAQADKDKAAKEKAAKEKAAKEKAEKERLAKAQADKDKVTKEKVAKEKAEKERLAKDKADKDKAAKDKAAKEKAEADRARALLEGQKSSPAAASSERKIVQFGTFSDPTKAAEARRKVESIGLKTYTQEIDGANGRMIRVRVGPFTQAGEAEAAEKRIKALGLPTAILTL